MTTSLHNLYRPTNLDKVIPGDNEQAITAIRGMVSSGKWPSAIGLFGPTSAGKTTLAYAIGCSALEVQSVADNGHPSFSEVVGTVTKGIDDIRALIAMSRNRPMRGSRRFILIDEAQGLLTNKQAAAALLGALERPPASTTWILTSMNPQAFMTSDEGRAIANRLTQFNLKPPSEQALKVYVKRILKGESMTYASHADVIQSVVDGSNGEFRTAANVVQGLQMYYEGLAEKPRALSAEDVSSVLRSTVEEADDKLAATIYTCVLNGSTEARAPALKAVNKSKDHYSLIQKVLLTSTYAMRVSVESDQRVPGLWPTTAYRLVAKRLGEISSDDVARVFPRAAVMRAKASAFAAPLDEILIEFILSCTSNSNTDWG